MRHRRDGGASTSRYSARHHSPRRLQRPAARRRRTATRLRRRSPRTRPGVPDGPVPRPRPAEVLLVGGRSGRAPQSIPLADFTLLLATTDEYGLLAPLRDRMRLVLRFDFYAAEELTELVRQRSRCAAAGRCEDGAAPADRPAVPWNAPAGPAAAPVVPPGLPVRGRGRDHRGHLLRACELEEIDELGLGPTEQQYLRARGRWGDPAQRDRLAARAAGPDGGAGRGAVPAPVRAAGQGRPGPAGIDRRGPGTPGRSRPVDA